MNISIVEGSMGVRVGGGGMEGEQGHWQAGQGDKERRGGDEGAGLAQRDPEGEMGGRADKDRGETGREEVASCVTTDSLLGESGTEGGALPMGEEGTGERDVVVGSDWSGTMEEGSEVAGSTSCEGFGVGEGGAEVGVGDRGKGEVMRGIGEDGWGEKGKVGD